MYTTSVYAIDIDKKINSSLMLKHYLFLHASLCRQKLIISRHAGHASSANPPGPEWGQLSG